MEEIYTILKDLGIEYKKYEHPPVFTSKEADVYWKNLDSEAIRCKNLFLRDQKKTRYFLVITSVKDHIDLKNLALKSNVDKFSFCSPEDLKKHLNLTPGSVSPFGLINDKKNKVEVVLAKNVMSSLKVSFHPNINTATLIIKTEDFKKFLGWSGNSWKIINL